MLLLAAASLASAAPPSDHGAQPRNAPISRAIAQAVVRLIDGEVVKLGSDGAATDRRARITILRLADGDREARIVEFE